MSSLRQVGHTLDASNCSQSPPSGLPDRSTPHLSSLTRSAISTSTLCLPGCCAPVYLATPPPAPMWKTQRATCVCVCVQRGTSSASTALFCTLVHLGQGGGVPAYFSSLDSQPMPVPPAAVFSVVWSSCLPCSTLLLAFSFLPQWLLVMGNGIAKFLVLPAVMATCLLAVY